jgi:hypothetical protein
MTSTAHERQAGQFTAVAAMAFWLLCALQPLMVLEVEGAAPALPSLLALPAAWLAALLGVLAAVLGLRPSGRTASLGLTAMAGLAAIGWLQLPPAQAAAPAAAGFWLGALGLGAVLMVVRKGRTFHRTAGWVWVSLVAVVAGSSIFITQLNHGKWSLIHLLLDGTHHEIAFWNR